MTPEHPFLIFYYENLPFDALFFHLDTKNTQNTPEHPKSPSIEKGVQVKSEHKRCSDLMLEVYVSKWNTKGVQVSILK